MKIKTKLLAIYKEKLKKVNSLPSSSPRKKSLIIKTKEEINNIKIGNYEPKKTDIAKISKTATKKLREELNKYTFDTDNESFYYWNTAIRSSKYASGGVDMVLTVLFKSVLTGNEYRYFGLISNRLDSKVSDNQCFEAINDELDKGNNILKINTRSGSNFQIKSFEIIRSERK